MLVLKTTAIGKKLITGLRDCISNEMSGYLVQLSLEQLQALVNGLDPLAELMKESQKQISYN